MCLDSNHTKEGAIPAWPEIPFEVDSVHNAKVLAGAVFLEQRHHRSAVEVANLYDDSVFAVENCFVSLRICLHVANSGGSGMMLVQKALKVESSQSEESVRAEQYV